MGQYYNCIVLKKDWKETQKPILAALSPYDFDNGAKLMEHSYIGNDYVSAFEALINKENGEYAGYPIIWAGDYADEEPNTFKKEKVNVYSLCDEARLWSHNQSIIVMSSTKTRICLLIQIR